MVKVQVVVKFYVFGHNFSRKSITFFVGNFLNLNFNGYNMQVVYWDESKNELVLWFPMTDHLSNKIYLYECNTLPSVQ